MQEFRALVMAKKGEVFCNVWGVMFAYADQHTVHQFSDDTDPISGTCAELIASTLRKNQTVDNAPLSPRLAIDALTKFAVLQLVLEVLKSR